MKIATININGKPHIVGIGNHETGYGHFIAWKFGDRKVLADVLIGGYWNNVFHRVVGEVKRVEIDTDELLPYIDYFEPMVPTAKPGTAVPKLAPDGIQLKIRAVESFNNESKDERFDHYYEGDAMGSNGENLNGTALALHVLMTKGVWILDANGNIIQPPTQPA